MASDVMNFMLVRQLWRYINTHKKIFPNPPRRIDGVYFIFVLNVKNITVNY